MKVVALYIALCGWCLFAACKKSENNDSAEKKLLVAGKWLLSASTATTILSGMSFTTDLYATMDTCEKDNTITYAGNEFATVDEGANICPGKPQTASGRWFLLDNNTKIAIMDSNPDTMTLEISSVQMKLTIVKPNSSGTPVTFINTYKNIK